MSRFYKYIFRDDLRDQLGDILALIRELTERQTALEYLQTVLRYVTGGTDRLTEEDLYEVIEGVFSEGGQIMPTIAEKWVQQGFEEGIREGIEKGIEKGIEEGMQRGKQEGQHQAMSDTLHQILKVCFPNSVAKLEIYQRFFDQLAIEDFKQLNEVALKAKTLADFEAALDAIVRKK